MSDEIQPIIKKIKKVEGHGHHGGAWKVAYADFVTAMMAFFLLLWLLNATSEEQKRGISNFFGPAGDLVGSGGSGGVLAGLTLTSEGILESDTTKGQAETDNKEHGKKGALEAPIDQEQGEGEESAYNEDELAEDSLLTSETGSPNMQVASDETQKTEKENFQEVTEALKQAVLEDPGLQDLAENLIIDETPEGLRIQIVDREKKSMFPSGEYEPLPHTIQLIGLVAEIIKKLPNKISVTGHTDSKPFRNKKDYSNWELSADRANSARRHLLKAGLTPDRMIYVTGKADTEHLDTENPFSDQNRRISIILHRNSFTDPVPGNPVIPGKEPAKAPPKAVKKAKPTGIDALKNVADL